MTDSAGLALAPNGLASAMVEHGLEVAGELTFSRVGLGQSNLTYLATDAAGRRWIVRRPPRGQLLASAHDVQREYRILEALQRSAVPVPRVLCSLHDERVADAPVVVMEYVDGLVVDTLEAAESLPRGIRTALSLDLPATLAAMHDVDLHDVGLESLGSHKPYAQRQLQRWSRQWAESRTRDLPELEDLTRLLRRNIPVQRKTALVHGDFHLRNLIADGGSGRIRAVLDWELSTLGDPLADVGTLLAYWVDPDDSDIGMFAAAALPGFVNRRELASAYVEATGADPGHIPFWHALGLWKIAIITEGVYRRALNEPSNAPQGGPPDRGLVPLIIARARALADEAGIR